MSQKEWLGDTYRVGDEENGRADVVLEAFEAKIGSETSHASIANIGTIEEREQVKQRNESNNPGQFKHKFFRA